METLSGSQIITEISGNSNQGMLSKKIYKVTKITLYAAHER